MRPPEGRQDYAELPDEDAVPKDLAPAKSCRRVLFMGVLAFATVAAATMSMTVQGKRIAEPLGLAARRTVVEVGKEDEVESKRGNESLHEVEHKDLEAAEDDPVLDLPESCPNSIGANLADNHEALEDDEGEEFYPFLSSHTFKVRNPQITHAIIWIHGFSGKVDEYFCNGQKFVKDLGVEETTMTIAPWFGAKTRIHGHRWNARLPPHVRMKVWGVLKWMTGEVREIDEATLSSFEMADVLAMTLQNRSLYPNLKKITIAGFSAGCQFASRYAFFSEAPLPRAGKARVQVLASNCGSYMYLDKNRPSALCRPPYDTGREHTCLYFPEPAHPAKVPQFNTYKVGLHGVKYDEEAIQKLIKLFPEKNIRFMFGSEDVCNCNAKQYVNPEHCSKISSCQPSVFSTPCCDTSPDNQLKNVLDDKPESMVQGYNRFQRGQNYVAYLRNFYSNESFPQFELFHGGHDALAFAYSKKFAEWTLDRE